MCFNSYVSCRGTVKNLVYSLYCICSEISVACSYRCKRRVKGHRFRNIIESHDHDILAYGEVMIIYLPVSCNRHKIIGKTDCINSTGVVIKKLVYNISAVFGKITFDNKFRIVFYAVSFQRRLVSFKTLHCFKV